MAQTEKGLEVDQDLEFQRRDWTFERAGWVAMLVVVVAALLGLLGDGPLSRAAGTTADHSLRVEYGRFERHGARARLTLFVRRDSTAGSAASLWIADEFLRGISLEHIEPQPVRQVSVGDRTLFDIAVAGDSARLTLSFTPLALGARRLELGLMGREPLTLSQFVYP
jgi:hypothetical protein